MATPETQFVATLKRLSTDEDGETQLTLRVPLSDLAAVMRLLSWTGKCLEVHVKPTPEKPF